MYIDICSAKIEQKSYMSNWCTKNEHRWNMENATLARCSVVHCRTGIAYILDLSDKDRSCYWD